MVLTMMLGMMPTAVFAADETGGDAVTYTYKIHMQNSKAWENPTAHMWDIAPNSNTNWPGNAMSANEFNTGWVDITVTTTNQSFGLIFSNNGASQTGDLMVAMPEGKTEAELWYTNNGSSVSDTAPAGWLTQQYYLVGYINGANHGCEEDWSNLGSYKFVDGQLTATFTQDSYVFVKTGDNSGWYLAESYCTNTTVALKQGASEKMYVPANKELQFTLVENADGSLTLSYVEKIDESVEATYIVAGDSGLCGVAWVADAEANKLTKNADGKYVKVYPNVAAGSYEFKITDGTWDNCWGDNGNNISFEVTAESNVIITFDPATKGIAVTLEDPATYIVAGDSKLCGSTWDAADVANRMTRNAEGKYEKVYSALPVGSYQFKVTNGTWDQAWGADGGNYEFSVNEVCDVTITFDPETESIKVTGTGIGKVVFEISSAHVVGNGSGNWLGGVAWDPAANQMTEVSENVYEITFVSVAAGSYEVKFAANGTWDNSWGGTFTANGEQAQAVYNGQNIVFVVEVEPADVTLQLDLSGYNHEDKSGAMFTLTVAEHVEEPAVDYYMVGYINGANYGCEEDYANLGEYKFVDGKLLATFEQDSYVMLKTGDNLNWFMADVYCTEPSVVLKNTTTGAGEKLFVPGGVELLFTLVENEDGTLTLSYAEAVPAVDYYMVGYINGADVSDAQEAWKFVDGKLKVTFAADSYVAVKSSLSNDWYMTSGWLGDVTTATLMQNAADANKLFVPANKEVEFTLVENADGTLTLSYAEVAQEPEATYIVAGEEGICGAPAWDSSNTANKMSRNEDGKYEITYTGVAAGSYQLKVTDGTWNNSWGNGSANYMISVIAKSNVTITFDPATKTVTHTVTEEVTDPAKTYYMVGYINGANYGCEGDYANLGEYKFVDGKLLATFEQDSYVMLKTGDNNNWFMADVYCTDPSVVLKNTSTGASEKLFVPGGTELLFSLTENEDGSLTLSYTANDYYLAGYLNGADVNDNQEAFKFSGGKLTTTFNQDSYVIVRDSSGVSYWTEVYCQDTTATLKPGCTEKMKVPGNAEITFTLVKNADGTLTLSYEAVREELTPDYYLVGYINGADYGIAGDSANLGSYKFEDGKLHAMFNQDSYVVVKNGNGQTFMTEVYCQSNYATLRPEWGEKMRVPGNAYVTFTLKTNEDGSLTLSYYSSVIVPPVPEGYNKVTVHFMRPDSWGGKINAWVWDANGALPGFEMYQTAWPGSEIPENGEHDNWFDVVIGTKEPQAFNFIFNDGTNQTADLSTGKVTGPTELWVVDGKVYTEAPKQWTHSTVTVHYQKPDDWNTPLKALAWTEETKELLGKDGQIMFTSPNAGWHSVIMEVENDRTLGFRFTDGTNQTADLTAGKITKNTELWFTSAGYKVNEPAGWIDVHRTVHVAGTFPGPSWDPASNKMTYDSELGLYTYTFKDVEPGTYAYKIAIDGQWKENYGADGVADGGDIKVTVPEKQDVTIWYSDISHRSVCSVNYDMAAQVKLTGTNVPEDTKLTDPTLSGVFSANVKLPAGKYEDLTLTYGGYSYTFAPFAVYATRRITFTFDVSTYMAQHNASTARVQTGKLFYNTKDLDFKAPFGAVATGEEVTFAMETGMDATQVSLTVMGVKAVMLEKDGEAVNGVQRWKGNTSFETLGEYRYYFAVSNDTNTVYYTDDNYIPYYGKGDYGTGTVRTREHIFAYDLVVYDADFTTPEWMKNAVIYQIFPDRFFDGDESNNQAQLAARGSVNYEYVSDWYLLPENPEAEGNAAYPVYALKGDGQWSNEIYGGDLEGITQRIGYLKALGVNVIYLNPVFSSISNHRYDACDYTQIDPILGTLGDFEELVAVAEENGMKIVLDGVFNHVSDDSVYFDRYYKYLGTSEKVGAYPYWAYVYDYMAEKGVSQDTAEGAARTYFTDNYGITDYSYTEWFAINNEAASYSDDTGLRSGKPVYTYEGWWGFDSMPVVKSTDGSEYRTGTWGQEIIGNAEGTGVSQYWISKGNNGWRLDVANEVSDESWQNFRDSVKALDSDAVIIGEIWFDAAHYLLGDMYDSVMNYVFRDAVAGFARGYQINRDNKAEKWDADYTAADAIATLEILRERYPEEAFYAMMNLVGSHDTARILSYLDDVEDDRHQKDMANTFPAYENTSDRAKGLQYVVSFIQFTYAGAPTIYYGDEIGMVGADDPDDRRAFEWGKGNQELVEWYATLAAIRAQYPALRTGSIHAFAPSRDVMGFVRGDEADTLVALANRAPMKSVLTLNLKELGLKEDGTYTDLITGNTYTAAGGKLTVTVEAYRGVILTEHVKEISVDKEALAPAYDPAYIVQTRSETAPKGSYVIPEGLTAAVGESLSVPVDAVVNTFVSASVNGQSLSAEEYQLRVGTQVILTGELTEKLGEGEHSLTLEFEGGSASGRFTVTKPAPVEKPTEPASQTPAQEEGSSGLLIAGIGGAGLIGVAAVVAALVSKKKKKA